MNGRLVLALALAFFGGLAFAENALENVERRTAEILKIDRHQVGEWIPEKGWIVTVGLAGLENKKPAEIIARRHELAEVAIMNAKLKLAEKLGFALSAEEKRQLWGDAATDKAGLTTSSRIQFLAKHQILGASVLLQSESNLDGEYLMAVSLVWTKGLQKSAATILSGRGEAKAATPGKYSLKEWLEKSIDPALVVGPRQYVDKDGKRHFIGFVSLPCDDLSSMTPIQRRKKILTLRRVLQMKGVQTATWALRSDVETSAVSSLMLTQTSVDGKEASEVASELTQRILQRYRGAMPPVHDIFEDGIIYREHPLFPGTKLAIYACELTGEFYTWTPSVK